MGAGLLALIIAGGFAGLVDLFERSDEDVNAEDAGNGSVPDTPEPELNKLMFNGDDELYGTEEDDLLESQNSAFNPTSPDSVAPHSPKSVFLGGGDDVAMLGAWDYVEEIHGGDGNDKIIGAFPSKIFGDAGDDTLKGGQGDELYGGVGNDLIEYHISSRAPDNGLVSGGDGNDTIQIFSDFGTGNTSEDLTVTVGGQEGEDQFDINLHLSNGNGGSASDTPAIDDGDLFRITDFNPDEDSLKVTISRMGGSEDREMTSAEITHESVEENGVMQEYTRLTMEFESGTDVPGAVVSVLFDGNIDLTTDEISIENV
ncbi:hypothetical protein [Halocynthiibacter sp.]|uniref:hypothetical protein n=1 Tax=Halocynthiibacter sp. TaxID=1979210 RepID=UPI003C33BA6C